jgi:hypothetical protein
MMRYGVRDTLQSILSLSKHVGHLRVVWVPQIEQFGIDGD